MWHAVKYFLIVFVVAILAAGGFVFWYIQSITHMEAICGGLKGEFGAEYISQTNAFDAIQTLAVEKGDVNICEQIPEFFCGEGRREQCYVRVAVATNDATICREKFINRPRHEDDSLRADWCLKEIAKTKDNPSSSAR